jgi:hypothetical protein
VALDRNVAGAEHAHYFKFSQILAKRRVRALDLGATVAWYRKDIGRYAYSLQAVAILVHEHLLSHNTVAAIWKWRPLGFYKMRALGSSSSGRYCLCYLVISMPFLKSTALFLALTYLSNASYTQQAPSDVSKRAAFNGGLTLSPYHDTGTPTCPAGSSNGFVGSVNHSHCCPDGTFYVSTAFNPVDVNQFCCPTSMSSQACTS